MVSALMLAALSLGANPCTQSSGAGCAPVLVAQMAPAPSSPEQDNAVAPPQTAPNAPLEGSAEPQPQAPLLKLPPNLGRAALITAGLVAGGSASLVWAVAWVPLAVAGVLGGGSLLFPAVQARQSPQGEALGVMVLGTVAAAMVAAGLVGAATAVGVAERLEGSGNVLSPSLLYTLTPLWVSPRVLNDVTAGACLLACLMPWAAPFIVGPLLFFS